MRLVPVDLRTPDAAVREADERDRLELPPVPLAMSFNEAVSRPDSVASGNNLRILKRADDLEVFYHTTRSNRGESSATGPSGELGAFRARFEALTGDPPFPWQERLFQSLVESQFPEACDIPTGLGKTSVIGIWLLALAARAEADSPDGFPRRLVYVVNRRTVVDQATREVERLRSALIMEIGTGVLQAVVAALRSLCVASASGAAARRPCAADGEVLAISTLRGEHADNAEWRRDRSRAAVIVGTVDMIGSRLLFQGYGRGFKSRPLHAAFLGQDSLLVHDEAHLEPAFHALLESLVGEQRRSCDPRPMRVMALSATSRGSGEAFRLDDSDHNHPVVRERLFAPKHLRLNQLADEKGLAAEIARLALSHKDTGQAVIVFLSRLDDVEQVTKAIQKEGLPCQHLTGPIRGLERDALAKSDPMFARFMPERDRNAAPVEGTVYLVCTSAGEVGVNISADHLVSDLAPFDRMAQRLGRVNRFGRGLAQVDIVSPPIRPDKGDESKDGKAKLTTAMLKTLAMLGQLPKLADGRHDASPAALADLPAEGRRSAFSPHPAIRAVTDILFDAWAFTTARKMPGRPAVAEWLHGVAEWEPPETRVAWREDVHLLKDDVCDVDEIEDLLDHYPLKPHEVLRDRSDRIFKQFEKIAARNGSAPVWSILNASNP
jgi:CRISPR-associated endonuclease/helicase Cas3